MTPIKGPCRPDLHLHTHASDGLLSPTEMVRACKAAGLDLIAITDHDGAAGVAEAMDAGRTLGLPVLAGIELSCGNGEEVHILGYGVDARGPTLLDFLRAQQRHRQERTLAIIDRLRALGMPLTPAEVRGRDADFMGRMGVADAMLAHGYVGSTGEAFDRYLNQGRPAFVPRTRVRVAEGVAMLASLGAVVSLAHPGRLLMEDAPLTQLLPQWIEAGLAGIEAYHSSHGQAESLRYDRLARRMGLLVTGGSDSHGRAHGAQIGAHLRHWRTACEDAQALLARVEA